jgi:hypothetical protein
VHAKLVIPTAANCWLSWTEISIKTACNGFKRLNARRILRRSEAQLVRFAVEALRQLQLRNSGPQVQRGRDNFTRRDADD